MASASDHRAHAALQPADCLFLLPQRLPAAVETSIGPAHYPAECTQSDAFLQPSLRARNGRANSNSLSDQRDVLGGCHTEIGTRHRPPQVSSIAFPAPLPDLQPWPLMDMDFAISRPLVRPEMPDIRFLFVRPRFCSTLPSDATSR